MESKASEINREKYRDMSTMDVEEGRIRLGIYLALREEDTIPYRRRVVYSHIEEEKDTTNADRNRVALIKALDQDNLLPSRIVLETSLKEAKKDREAGDGDLIITKNDRDKPEVYEVIGTARIEDRVYEINGNIQYTQKEIVEETRDYTLDRRPELEDKILEGLMMLSAEEGDSDDR